jgi:hypothetical protein
VELPLTRGISHGVIEFVSVPVDTPSDVALVDVTVTVTDYDTSAGDFGEIDVVIVSDDGTRAGRSG